MIAEPRAEGPRVRRRSRGADSAGSLARRRIDVVVGQRQKGRHPTEQGGAVLGEPAIGEGEPPDVGRQGDPGGRVGDAAASGRGEKSAWAPVPATPDPHRSWALPYGRGGGRACHPPRRVRPGGPWSRRARSASLPERGWVDPRSCPEGGEQARPAARASRWRWRNHHATNAPIPEHRDGGQGEVQPAGSAAARRAAQPISHPRR